MPRAKGGKPGNPTWVKGGPSPNPGGRPPGPIQLRKRYKDENGDDALYERLMSIVKNGSDSDAIRAAALLFERVYGKAEDADPERSELERATMKAKLKMLEQGHDPDATVFNITLSDAVRRDGDA